METSKLSIVASLLPAPDPVLEFGDRELSSYIYGMAYREVCLDSFELTPRFLYSVLSKENLEFLLGVYLNHLEHTKSPKYAELKHGETFDASKTLRSLSDSLMENFGENAGALQVLKEKLERDYIEKNPLEELLYGERSYLKGFCDGLELSHKERLFLLLNLLNSQWGWLFPSIKDDSYNAGIFNVFLKKESNSPTVLARELNNRFIKLGLFSGPWEVHDYVTSFFNGELRSFSLRHSPCNQLADSYDYGQLHDRNKDDARVMTELMLEACEKGKSCYELACGTEYHRLRNFCAYICEKQGLKLYELKEELHVKDGRELDFYIYALSCLVQGNRTVILLPPRESSAYFTDRRPGKAVSGNLPESIMSHMRVPVILCSEESVPDAEARLGDSGMDLLFTFQMRLPEEDRYTERVTRFFYDRKIPSGLIGTAAEACGKMKLSPGKWAQAGDLLMRAGRFTKEEARMLLENKFREDAAGHKADRGNAHYCLDALNTTEPIQELTEALKNADAFEEEEYNASSGTRILLTGPSGTGKTAFAEQIARSLHRPLNVIRASEVLGSYVGETERNIKATFEEAAREKAVLLIDEADSFLHSRGDGVNRHNDLKVNEFLIQMEKFPGILFCNTNLPDQLDKATDRRFHFKVGFKPLTKEGVAMLCESYFGRYGISEPQVQRICAAGDVCPGDFGAVYGKIRFVAADKLDADYITEELCKVVEGKKRSWEGKSIGFGAR